MKKTNKRGEISYDRWTQIINNVAEEYIDLGRTDFATKAELCDTIIALREHQFRELSRKDAALDEILNITYRARLYQSNLSHEK